MLTIEETEAAIDKDTTRFAKMFVRGLWEDKYCMLQCLQISNQYGVNAMSIYDKFRKKAELLWQEQSN